MLHLSAATARKIKGNRDDFRIVVGRLQLCGEEPAAAIYRHGRVISVGGRHGVAPRNFKNIIGGQFTDILLGRYGRGFRSANLHVIDRHRVPQVLMHLELDIADGRGVKEEFPAAIPQDNILAARGAQLDTCQGHQAAIGDFHRGDGNCLLAADLNVNRAYACRPKCGPV